MATKKGTCTHYAYCKLADKGEVVELQAEAEFVCPECKKALTEKGSKGPGKALIFGGIAVVAVAGLMAFLFSGGEEKPQTGGGELGTPAGLNTDTQPLEERGKVKIEEVYPDYVENFFAKLMDDNLDYTEKEQTIEEFLKKFSGRRALIRVVTEQGTVVEYFGAADFLKKIIVKNGYRPLPKKAKMKDGKIDALLVQE